MEVMARKNSTPMFMSLTARPGPKGTTAKPISMPAAMAVGAKVNTTRSEKGGTQSCLVNSFTTSATICSRPKGPTRFGPKRSCQKPSSRRSHQMSKAAESSAPPSTGAIMMKAISSSRSIP